MKYNWKKSEWIDGDFHYYIKEKGRQIMKKKKMKKKNESWKKKW